MELVQNLFMSDDTFDRGLIFILRKLTKNFIMKHSERSINELPLSCAPMLDGEDSLESYCENIVMKMYTDAIGVLFAIVPIALRISIYIVDVDTSEKSRKAFESGKFDKIIDI